MGKVKREVGRQGLFGAGECNPHFNFPQNIKIACLDTCKHVLCDDMCEDI